ncbi:hypothetical protein RUM44_010999 [Polyplax serrata]|uniref:Uncharacterized protein n=1 Tax=Polyplax serrata TaxID=468196 RepID=A0ABR1ANU6_POLSC
MRSENSSSSPGESPQLGNPWDALLKNSLTPQVVDRSEKPTREKQNSMSNQSGSFSWKHLSFRKLSLGDRDGIPPLLSECVRHLDVHSSDPFRAAGRKRGHL